MKYTTKLIIESHNFKLNNNGLSFSFSFSICSNKINLTNDFISRIMNDNIKKAIIAEIKTFINNNKNDIIFNAKNTITLNKNVNIDKGVIGKYFIINMSFCRTDNIEKYLNSADNIFDDFKDKIKICRGR